MFLGCWSSLNEDGLDWGGQEERERESVCVCVSYRSGFGVPMSARNPAPGTLSLRRASDIFAVEVYQYPMFKRKKRREIYVAGGVLFQGLKLLGSHGGTRACVLQPLFIQLDTNMADI